MAQEFEFGDRGEVLACVDIDPKVEFIFEVLVFRFN